MFHEFDIQGVRWVNLEESMAGNCGVFPSPNVVPGSDDKLYDHKHDPAYAYRANSSCKANDRPLTSDAQLQALPSFSFIVPNNCDNAHTYPSHGDCRAYFGTNHGSNQINLADKWVAHVVGVITAADPSVTVFVTFDESTESTHQLLYAAEIGPGISGRDQGRPPLRSLLVLRGDLAEVRPRGHRSERGRHRDAAAPVAKMGGQGVTPVSRATT